MQALQSSVLLVVLLVLATVAPTVGTAQAAGDASIERIGAWQAPSDEITIENASDVRTAIANGTLERGTGLAVNDTLVVELTMPGFQSAVSDAGGSNTTERFLTALSSHGDLVIRQWEDSLTTHGVPLRLDPFGGGVQIVADQGNATYYLVTEFDELERVEDGSSFIDPHEERVPLTVEATLFANSSFVDQRQRVVAPVHDRQASVVTGLDDLIYGIPDANLTVVGGTDVGTGQRLVVAVEGRDDPETTTDESFRRIRTATVDLADGSAYETHEKGTFATTFDLPQVSTAATNITVDVRLDDRSLLEAPVAVDVTDPAGDVAVERVQSNDSRTAVVTNASLSDGGFLALHNGTATGPVVGHTPFLDAGNHTTAVYGDRPVDPDNLVAVAHYDVNRNEWFDGPKTDSVYSNGDAADPVRSTTTTPTPTTTTTRTEATSEHQSTPTTGTGPGFGVVVAIIAATSLTVLFQRRR